MKKTSLLVAFLAIMSAPALVAAVNNTTPMSSGVMSSAGQLTKMTANAVKAALAGKGMSVTTMTPILMPSVNSPTSVAAQNALIADAMAGNLHGGPASGPSDYSVIWNYSVGWSNLVYSTSATIWQGILQNNSGALGQVTALLVYVQSVSGSDDISLSQLTFNGTSVDGLLNSTYGFSGLNYTPQAPGTKADGTLITSGSVTQLCKGFWVIIYPSMFNGGGTQSGLDSVKSYVGAHSPYVLEYSTEMNVDTNTISTIVLNVGPIIPVVAIDKEVAAGTITVWVSNGESNHTYQIETSSTLDPVNWSLLATAIGTNSVSVPMTTGSAFFRASVQ